MVHFNLDENTASAVQTIADELMSSDVNENKIAGGIIDSYLTDYRTSTASAKATWLHDTCEWATNHNIPYNHQVLEFIADFIYHQGGMNAEIIQNLFAAGYCWHFANILRDTFSTWCSLYSCTLRTHGMERY